MDGTCLEMPDQRGGAGDSGASHTAAAAAAGDGGGPLVLHFGTEVLRVQQVMASAVQVHHDVARCGQRVARHLDGWRRHADVWRSDRGALLAKFKAKAPPCAAFEEKFARFHKVGKGH